MRVVGNVLADNAPGVTFRDGVSTFDRKTTLHVNPADFYLTRASDGNPIVNLDNGFSGVLLEGLADNSYASGVTETESWAPEYYDVGGWFSTGSPTVITVPAGVSMIKAWVKVVMTPTGTPTAAGYVTVAILKNGAAFIAGQALARYAIVAANGIATVITFETPAVFVTPGDQLSVQITTVYATATNNTFTAAQSAFGAYKVR